MSVRNKNQPLLCDNKRTVKKYQKFNSYSRRHYLCVFYDKECAFDN